MYFAFIEQDYLFIDRIDLVLDVIIDGNKKEYMSPFFTLPSFLVMQFSLIRSAK
ncbi:hypothetical protein ES705_40734 [subsurface metagenome]